MVLETRLRYCRLQAGTGLGLSMHTGSATWDALASASIGPILSGVGGRGGPRTMPLGPTFLLVVVEVDFADGISASEVERASDRLRNAVAAAVGEAGDPRLVVVDPRARARARRAIA